MGKKILLLGGGGHCRSVLDSLLACDDYNEIGIVDFPGTEVPAGFEIVGSDEDLPRLLDEGWTNAFVTLGSIGNTKHRRKLYRMVKELGFEVPSIIDPTAVLAWNAEVADGVYIGKNAVVNSSSEIAVGAIINTGVIVEHDCRIGSFAHISPGAVICGEVHIGNGTHVGAAAVIRQEISIGDDTMIGAGSVVVDNLPSSVTAYGNPCKVVK